MQDANNEFVRHFLIEPTSKVKHFNQRRFVNVVFAIQFFVVPFKGVKLKGYSNEPVFASLSALIYQHTITALALPTKLVLPQRELGGKTIYSTMHCTFVL